MIELIVQSGKHQGRHLRIPSQGNVIIGRDDSCQIRLASSDVSRHHCLLRETPDGIVARDLDSRNGTYLNETLMEEETLLKPGDVLRVGPIALQLPGGPAQTEPKASEDDIANWLGTTEAIGSSSGVEPASGDTTVIPRPATLDRIDPPPPPVIREQPRQFRTVAEEAADIIRRHWDMVKSQRDQG